MPASDAGLGTAWDRTQGYFSTLVTDMYLPWVANALNNASVLLSMLPEESYDIAGKFVFMPVKYGRNTRAFSAVREGGKIADPGAALARPYMFRPRKFFFRAIIDGDIYRASQLDAVRYVDALEDIMAQGAGDMAVDFNRQVHNDGSGRLAEISVVNAGAGDYTLRLNQSIESVATCQSNPADFLGGEYLGRRVMVISPAGIPKGVRQVTVVDPFVPGPPSSVRVTLALSDGTPLDVNAVPGGGVAVAGDWVVPCARFVSDAATVGEEINSGFRTELPGIAGIFGDSFVLDGNGVALLPAGALNYVGQDEFAAVGGATVGFQGAPVTAAEPWNMCQIMDGGGVLREPTEELLQIAFDRAEETNNAQIDMLMSGYGERSRHAEQLLPDKRYTNTTVLSGGWTALDYKGKPWVADRHTYKNRIYCMGLRSGGFKQFPRTPFQPLDPMGPHWYRLQDDDKYQAAWVGEGTHGVEIRQRIGVLVTDIRRSA